jgi:hypothetical protein
LKSFLGSSGTTRPNRAGGIDEGAGISDTEVVPLLRNTDLIARMIGLRILYKNAKTQSVELALPLLKDSEKIVRARTAATLRALTGQHFTDEQADEWEKWWNENKTNFVVQLHPEEFRPQRRRTNDFRFLTNRPPVRVPWCCAALFRRERGFDGFGHFL